MIPTQMRSQLSPQCHHLAATTPSLQGAQGVSFLQFPEHLLGPGLELGVVIRDNRVSVSWTLSIVLQTWALGKCWALGLWGQTSQTEPLPPWNLRLGKEDRHKQGSTAIVWLPLAYQLQGDSGRKENCRQMDECMATQGEMTACGGVTKVIKASSLGNWGSEVNSS